MTAQSVNHPEKVNVPALFLSSKARVRETAKPERRSETTTNNSENDQREKNIAGAGVVVGPRNCGMNTSVYGETQSETEK